MSMIRTRIKVFVVTLAGIGSGVVITDILMKPDFRILK
jgi:hypothetical protein